MLDGSSPEKQRGSLRKFAVQSEFTSGKLHGLIVYPDGVLLTGLQISDVAKVAAATTMQKPIRQALAAAGLDFREAPWQGGSEDSGAHTPASDDRGIVLRQIPGITIMVCAHRARHHRCGECGDTTLEMLGQAGRDMDSDHAELRQKGAAGTPAEPMPVHVFPSTHLGGSLLGANMVVHPSGDWFGRMHDFFDVQAVVTLYAGAAQGKVLPMPGSVNHFLAADSERNLRLVRSAQKQGIPMSIPAEAIRAMQQQEARQAQRGIQTPFEGDAEQGREKVIAATPEIPADERAFLDRDSESESTATRSASGAPSWFHSRASSASGIGSRGANDPGSTEGESFSASIPWGKSDEFPSRRPEDAPAVAQLAVGSMHQADDVAAASIGDSEHDGGSTRYDATARLGGPMLAEDDPFDELDRFGRSIDSGLSAKVKPFPDWFQPKTEADADADADADAKADADAEGAGEQGSRNEASARGGSESAERESEDESGETATPADLDPESAAQADADRLRDAMQAEQKFGQDAFSSKIFVGGSLQSAEALVGTASDRAPEFAQEFVTRLGVSTPSPAAVAAVFAHVWRGRMGLSTEEQRVVAEAAKKSVAGARYSASKSASRSSGDILELQLDGPSLPGDSIGALPAASMPGQQGGVREGDSGAGGSTGSGGSAAPAAADGAGPGLPDVVPPKRMATQRRRSAERGDKVGGSEKNESGGEALGEESAGTSRPQW